MNQLIIIGSGQQPTSDYVTFMTRDYSDTSFIIDASLPALLELTVRGSQFRVPVSVTSVVFANLKRLDLINCKITDKWPVMETVEHLNTQYSIMQGIDQFINTFPNLVYLSLECRYSLFDELAIQGQTLEHLTIWTIDDVVSFPYCKNTLRSFCLTGAFSNYQNIDQYTNLTELTIIDKDLMKSFDLTRYLFVESINISGCDIRA